MLGVEGTSRYIWWRGALYKITVKKKTDKIEVVRRLTGISRRSFAALRYEK